MRGGRASRAGQGNPQDFADRLDPVGITVPVSAVDQDLSRLEQAAESRVVANVPVSAVDQDLSRRSSSAWAKNALASFRISWALLFLDLAFQDIEPLPFVTGDAIPRASVDLVLAHPVMQRLRNAADLWGH